MLGGVNLSGIIELDNDSDGGDSDVFEVISISSESSNAMTTSQTVSVAPKPGSSHSDGLNNNNNSDEPKSNINSGRLNNNCSPGVLNHSNSPAKMTIAGRIRMMRENGKTPLKPEIDDDVGLDLLNAIPRPRHVIKNKAVIVPVPEPNYRASHAFQQRLLEVRKTPFSLSQTF